VAPQRRRGQALETALLDAAWAELTERGYDELTIDAVATRAATSRAVLYRRWPSKQDLVRATLSEHVRKDSVDAPDTGSLRGDVLALLNEANKLRVRVAVLLFTRLVGSTARPTPTWPNSAHTSRAVATRCSMKSSNALSLAATSSRARSARASRGCPSTCFATSG
jgi:AcrR family transcriptional regulator